MATTQKQSLTLMGEAEFKLGINLDLSASFVGLSRFVYIDIYAEGGVYAEFMDILQASSTNTSTGNGEQTQSDEFYNAAYFEVGLYLDVGVGYKVFAWGNSMSLLGGEKRFPLWQVLTTSMK